MSGMCPSCGFNLQRDVEIVAGDWRIDPREGTFYAGERVAGISVIQSGILHTLAKSAGRNVTVEALGNRHSSGDNTENIMRVQICRMRNRMSKLGLRPPFETVHGCGYRWTGASA